MSEAPRFEQRGDGRYAVTGDLTFETVAAALELSEPVLRDGPSPLTLDLAAVKRTDSAGLALLIEWMRRARGVGREIRYSNMPAQMHAIARVSDLDTFLPVTQAE